MKTDERKKLREEFAKLRTESMDAIDGAIKLGRDLSEDEQKKNDERHARCTTIRKLLEEENRFADLALSANADVLDHAQRGITMSGPGAGGAGRQQLDAAAAQELFGQQQAEAVEFIRTGRGQLAHTHVMDSDKIVLPQHRYIVQGSDVREEFVLITTSGSSVMLPSIPAQPVVIRRLANPIMAAILSRGFQPLYTAGTENVPLPLFDDTGNDASNPAQDDATDLTQDPSVSGLTLGAALYDSKAMWLSNTLINAASYDLLGYVEPMLQKRIDRQQHAVWIKKITDNATVGKTCASAAGVTYAELLAWKFSVPIPYWSDLTYMLSAGFLQVMEGLTDNYGRPLWVQSLQDGEPDRFFGAPVFPSDKLVDPAAGIVTGIAASAECLRARLCTNRRLARYVNVPTHKDQVGLEMFVNGDFDFIRSGVRTLKMGAGSSSSS